MRAWVFAAVSCVALVSASSARADDTPAASVALGVPTKFFSDHLVLADGARLALLPRLAIVGGGARSFALGSTSSRTRELEAPSGLQDFWLSVTQPAMLPYVLLGVGLSL